MPRINFDEHIKVNRSRCRRYHLMMRKKRRSQPRREHLRDPDERASLIQVNLSRLTAWLADGTLKEIGPRKYRLRL